jgi:hypothetical protein
MTTFLLMLTMILNAAPKSNCETFTKDGVAHPYQVTVCGGTVKLGVL